MAETLVPGASVSVIARRAGIHPAQLFGWRRRVLRQGAVQRVGVTGPHFVEVESSGSGAVEIVIGGIIVRAGKEIDEDHLRRVIRAVRN